MILALKTFWTNVKKHWKIAVAVLAVVVVAVASVIGITSWDSYDPAKRIEAIKKAHEEEIRQIEAARAAQQTQTQTAASDLVKTLDAVQKQYDANNVQLDEEKKRKIAALIQSADGDTDALLKKLADAAGFPIVLPE